jgi:hypothetical protein
MRTIETNCLPGSAKNKNLKLYSLMVTLLLLFASTNLLAQTISFPTSCTSKDLSLLQASLPAPTSNRCACSGDRSLILGIHNGTGSTRTAFALWGTLRITTGATHVDHTIFACAGPIPPNGDYFLNATTIKIDDVDVPTASIGGLTLPVIHIDCGQSLDIVDMHLAWTAATPGANCASLYASPSTINPKCGTQALIHVDLGLEANVVPTQSTCTTGGQIVVTPRGGLPSYQVCLYRKTSPAATDSILRGCIAVSGTTTSATFTGLGDSSYTIKTTDNMGVTDATQRCSFNTFVTIANPNSVTAPNATAVQPGCGGSTGTVNVTSPISGVSYNLLQGGVSQYGPSTTGVFTGVVPGTYDLKATLGACTATHAAAVTVNSAPANPSFSVCITQPTLCSRGSLTITASGGTGFSYRINGTSFDDVAATKNSTGTFSNLLPGDVTTVQVKNAAGCVSNAVSCGSLTSVCSGSVTRRTQQEPLVFSNDNPTVKAYPNPFNDHVKFVVNSPAAGSGSLEVYNVMGQKVKTVYQGRINAGNQSYELVIPKKQQETLIYILRVDGKKVTGKLLQLNN